MADKTVKMHIQGNLVISQYSPAVLTILQNVLSFERQIFERLTYAQKKKMGVSSSFNIYTERETYCWHQEDPHDVFGPTILFYRGYLQKAATALKSAGYRVLVKEVTDKQYRFTHKPRWDYVDANVEWRYRQREVMEILANNHNAHIICPTGYGKSFLIGTLARLYHKAKIVVTTYAQSTLQMLYQDLRQYIPSVGIHCSKQKKYLNSRVLCYSRGTLKKLTSEPDILLVDESHEWGTKNSIEILASFIHARMYGFSANATRPDGAHHALEQFFGPPAITIDYKEAVDNATVVPIEVEWVRDDFGVRDPATGAEGTELERAGVWRNHTRNKQIAAQARRFDEDVQVLIAVKTLDHAVNLKRWLPEFTLVYSELTTKYDKARFFRWKRQGFLPKDEPFMSTKRRYYLQRQFEQGNLKKVICTTVWERGVDFSDLQVMIRGDAADSVIKDTQIPGRVTRIGKKSDKEVGLVIDFEDTFNETLKRKAMNRKRRYNRTGWKQRTISPLVYTRR